MLTLRVLRFAVPFAVIAVSGSARAQGTSRGDTIRLVMGVPLTGQGCAWRIRQRTSNGFGITLSFDQPDTGGAAEATTGSSSPIRQQGGPQSARLRSTDSGAARPRGSEAAAPVLALVPAAGSAPVQIDCAPASSEADGARKAAAADVPFAIATGVEFASANGFQSQQLRIPVTTSWIFDAATSTLPWGATFHHTLEIMAEGGSVIIPQSFSGCLPGSSAIVGALDTMSTNAAIARNDCRIRRLDRLSDSLFRRTYFADQADALQGDTTATTAYTWRLGGLYRVEGERGSSNLFIGPAVLVGLSTNPTGPSVNTLGNTERVGLSFRQTDASRHEIGQFLALWGHSTVFNQTVQTEYAHPFSASDSTKVTTHLSAPLKDAGFLFRILLSPADGFYIRGYAEVNRHAPSLATIAILKTIDFKAALKGLGIS